VPSFSARSLERLRTCDPRLQRLFERVVAEYDCTILEGHRGREAQERAFQEGRSKIRWPDGLHNALPSFAVDVAPHPVDWNDLKRFYHFGGFVQGVAAAMGLPLRWGGDWDGDNDLGDQRFNDLVHFELVDGR
jgi:peptidoglycan L-alanyl-D-glutamate endopeptidase CwlK